ALRDINRNYDRLHATLRLEARDERRKAASEIDDRCWKQYEDPVNPVRLVGILWEATNVASAKGIFIAERLMYLYLGIASLNDSNDRMEQTRRNVLVGFALAAYKADHGSYPKLLDSLAPKYLAKVPDDHFSGKALIYRLTDDGYLLYSVGVNGVDDNGQ